jgi:peptide/nickel transport system permease protein
MADTLISDVDLAGPEPAVPVEVEQAPTKKLGIGGILAIVWLGFVGLLALTAPFLPFADDYDTPSAAAKLKGPFEVSGFPLGGDISGRDMVDKLVWGTRYSVMVAVGAIAIGFLVGGTIGLVGGYFRGRLDTLLTGFLSVLLAIPQLVLALALVAVFASDYVDADGVPHSPSDGRRILVLIFALGIVSAPILGRITRANTLVWSQREFVMAAKAQGAKNFRIIFREVLPNVLPAMFSIALLGIAVVMVAEAGLSILTLGIPVDKPSLGNIIAAGRDALAIRNTPHIVFEPVIVIFLTVMSLNYLGDVVRARFDVRESAV